MLRLSRVCPIVSAAAPEAPAGEDDDEDLDKDEDLSSLDENEDSLNLDEDLDKDEDLSSLDENEDPLNLDEDEDLSNLDGNEDPSKNLDGYTHEELHGISYAEALAGWADVYVDEDGVGCGDF